VTRLQYGERVTTPRRLFLHVGCPKTGTTFLQDTLWASRDRLATAGLLLPLRHFQDHFFVTLAVREQLDPGMDPPEAHNVLDRLSSELNQSTSPRVIISHELLAPATAEQAGRLRARLSDFEIHVIVTVRDLQRQIPAAWQQQIQQRGLASYDRFCAAVVDDDRETAYFWDRQDPVAVAERWRGDLPPDRIHVVTVPPPGADPELLMQRFCRVLDIEPADLNRDVSRPNESLGLPQAELLRRVNVALGDRLPHPRAGHSRIAKAYFARQVLAPQGGRRPVLPPDLADWCHDTSKRIVDGLAGAGYDVVGELTDLLPGTAADPVDLTVNDREMVEAAVEALAAVLDQRYRDVQRIGSLRARLRAATPGST
jgi:hypothetical protein